MAAHDDAFMASGGEFAGNRPANGSGASDEKFHYAESYSY